MLINCVAEKTNAHSHTIVSVVFSPDGTKIVSGSADATIKVWDSGAPRAQNRPPWPKLTPAGSSGRQTGDAEREDERAQRLCHVGGVFPGRDQDCVRIDRQDDQSLGLWCAAALKSSPWPKLMLAALSGRHEDGAVERENERAQQRHDVSGVFPGRDQDRVRIG
jgi:hypothetical protein